MSNQSSTFFSPPPSGPIKPYTGTFGKKQLHHLLRRTLFGVSTADLKAFENRTMSQVVDSLLNVSATPPAPPVKNYSTAISRQKQAIDPVTGKPKVDSAGNPIYVPILDAQGNQKKDAQGKLLWVMETVATDDVYDMPNAATNVKYAAWKGLKMGDTWVNYRVNPADSGNMNSDNVRRNSLKSWWAKLMLEQERTVREKMTFFWHNHFATEVADINNAIMSYNHIALLRKYALGNFKKMVYDVTLDPAMLIYLNGNTNDGSKPTSVNENYARELQELFTVGKGLGSSYTEDDVKAAARVLSGWLVLGRNDATNKEILDPAVPYSSIPAPGRHDKTDKVFSAFYGNKVIKGDGSATGGASEITQLVDMIFSVDEVSKFICRKLFTFFVYYKIDDDIEKNVIEPLAELFRTSKFEIKPVLKALFTSEYFYKQEYVGAMVKNPIDFMIGHWRTLEYKIPADPKNYEIQYSIASTLKDRVSSLGLNLGDPPNVAGWAAYYQEPLFYEVWLDSSSISARLARRNDTGFSFGNSENQMVYYESASNSLVVNGNLTLPINWLNVIFNIPDSNDLNVAISELCSLFYPSELSQAIKDKVKARFFAIANANDLKKDAHWTTGMNALKADINSTNVNAIAVKTKVVELFKLLFTAAEYQLH